MKKLKLKDLTVASFVTGESNHIRGGEFTDGCPPYTDAPTGMQCSNGHNCTHYGACYSIYCFPGGGGGF